MIRILLFLLLISVPAYAVNPGVTGTIASSGVTGDTPVPPAPSCDKYWVGGTATWDATAGSKWATSSGGAGGAAIPTSSDDVCFDSGSGAVTVTASSSSVARDLNFVGPDASPTEFTGTFTIPASTTIVVSGSLSLSSSMTLTGGSTSTSNFTMNATTTGHTVTTNGKTIPGLMEFNGTGGGWTLMDTFNSNGGAATALRLTAGSLDTNDQAINLTNSSSGFQASGSTTRTLDLGSSIITIAGSNGVTMTTVTGLTLIEGTSKFILSGSTASFSGGGETYYDLEFTGTGAKTLSGANTFHDLTVTLGSAVQTSYLNVSNANQTVTGTFTVDGFSEVARPMIRSNTIGTARTITAAAVRTEYADFRDITGAGAASWDLSAATGGSGDCVGNSGITFTTADDLYWVGGTGSWTANSEWSTSSGGAGGARIPLCQDTAYFDANSFSAGSQTLTVDYLRIPHVDGSAVTNNPTLSKGNAADLHAGFLWASTTAATGAGAWTFVGRGTHTISINPNWPAASLILIDSISGTYSLGDDLTFTASNNMATRVSVVSGTFDFNDKNYTATAFNSSGSGTRTVNLGAGTIQIKTSSASNSSPWDTGTVTNLTFNAETSTIEFYVEGTNNYTFNAGGLTYNNIIVKDRTSTGNLRTGSSLTIANLTLEQDSKFQIASGTTVTVSSTMTCAGASGNTIELSALTGTPAISKSSGTVACDWITITNVTAGGGATFTATNSTCTGTTTGWSCS